MLVSTFLGSITDPRIGAHAIVNASNPAVGLGSGVSGAIREACGGLEFQREVRERLEEEYGDELEQGDVLVTSAGIATAFRWVIHVPGVDYKHPDRETGGVSGPSRVRDCVRAALTEAIALAREHQLAGQFVLATPLIAAGHGGLGAVASIDAMIQAVRGTMQNGDEEERQTIARVVFAVLKEEEARLVRLAAERYRL